MNIQIYTKPGCPYCDKIKAVLDQRDIGYSESELDVDYTREEFTTQFGDGTTFPQVIIDGENIGGCSDAVKYLVDNGII